MLNNWRFRWPLVKDVNIELEKEVYWAIRKSILEDVQRDFKEESKLIKDIFENLKNPPL